MDKNGAHANGPVPGATAVTWMSLKAASELTGRTRDYLRDQIAAGELAARTIRRGDKVEYRLTRAALAEAGLIGAPPRREGGLGEGGLRDAAPDTLVELIALIREQNQRIASLEDQRAQLAARLGATVEAMHQLEDRLEAILDARSTSPSASPTPADAGRPVTTDDGLVLRPGSSGPSLDETARQLLGVRRSLTRLVREVAQPRLRELAHVVRREPAPGSAAGPPLETEAPARHR